MMSKPLDLTSKKKKSPPDIIPKGYKPFLEDLKSKIRSSQIKAAVRVNSTLIELYWQIGKDIVSMQEKEKWGTQVIERLAKDLQNDFPGIQGFSRRNLFYMRKFAESYQDFAIVQQVAALIPWGHNLILMDRVENQNQRLWYAQKTIEHGWSRNSLEDWIKSDLYSRQGKAITNFHITLPKPQSDLAEQSLKDPYCLDFLTLMEGYREKELEQALIDDIQKVLLELGKGFAFVGRQVALRMNDADYYIDLLFYHYKLHCFFVVELKNPPFKPEYAGKMGFYLAAVDNCLKAESDNRNWG